MSNTLFQGGLAAAFQFSNELSAAAFADGANSRYTVGTPNRIGIIPPNITEVFNIAVFDEPMAHHAGGDTEDSNVWGWYPKPPAVGGSCFTNMAELQDAFRAGGIDAAQAMVDSAPRIDPE